MKAYRQITFQREHRLVGGYTAILIVAGLFMIMRPVLAQDKKQVPDLRVEVNKEYDVRGNLVRVDSVRSWTWSGSEYTTPEFDSVWKQHGLDFRDFLPRSFDAYGHLRMLPWPPMPGCWHWNGEDSTAYSYLEDLFDEELLQDLWGGSGIPPHPGFGQDMRLPAPASPAPEIPERSEE